MINPSEATPPRWLERVHHALLVALIALRPLVWSGDASAWDNLAYLALIAAATLLLTVESWAGWRRAWRWGPGGLLFAALCVALLPATLRSPLPSQGWGLWGMLAMHLLLAIYLVQVMSGRERLAWAALLGALALESVIALLQQAWVLPGISRAMHAGDPEVMRFETHHGDLATRVRDGGIFGTFTLANILAAYLLVLLPPLAAAACARGLPPAVRSGALILLGLALGAFAGTASKGAYLALAGAAGLWWLWRVPGWWRWLPLPAGLAALTLAFAHPGLRAGLTASAEVRVGYWQSAATLVSEAPLQGHGLGGFAAEGLRAMPLWAEPSHYVHNEVLEAAADAGLIVALLLAALLMSLPLRVRPFMPVPPPTAGVAGAVYPLLVLVPFFCALGMLSSNLEWWPYSVSDAGWLMWTLALGSLLAAVVALGRLLPLPPPWAWQVALGACALHCLIDFDLHSPGIWGTLIVAAALAGRSRHVLAITRARLIVASMLVAVILIACGFGWARALDLQRAERLIELDTHARVSAITRPEHLAHDFAALADALGQTIPEAATPSAASAIYRALDAAARERALLLSQKWPRSAELELAAAGLWPAGSERLTQLETVIGHQPTNPSARLLLADDLAALGRWDEALAAGQEAIRLAPANLARRTHVAELFERAAVALPAQADALSRAATEERQRIATLMLIVNPSNRP